ncbi:RidA family protein [Alkaliphilus peptidifermentans]|uniref:Enamine deaminase RidA, house cleaning of reactive enamine intermediates, YjgF/YER057c/UK114 family n=1 Tax=Alkaliphilus peptidifermentans DSM 18978 TaxID=1120976 RepID=A0A1G5GXN6_9FIRM|nr:RidA family protein [Alkaliphilus peptidifermentans]SCY56254.1 Enamine deaminase RidA, house cleaning of reactive enamine intermediates, YjgF/YER057c/UK114 family [Alkaliphilus peptidifermentans DSM 18978]
MKEFRNPSNIHSPVAAYTHQIEVTGNTRWLVLSGQLGKDEKGFVSDDPINQIEIALDNIKKNLQAANMEVKDLVKVVFYLVGDMDNLKRREIISKFFDGHMPCMTMLYVTALADPSFKVEIDAWGSSDI